MIKDEVFLSKFFNRFELQGVARLHPNQIDDLVIDICLHFVLTQKLFEVFESELGFHGDVEILNSNDSQGVIILLGLLFEILIHLDD